MSKNEFFEVALVRLTNHYCTSTYLLSELYTHLVNGVVLF